MRVHVGKFLMCVPRSGSGFKYGLRLKNSVGIIDSDFYSPQYGSEGHIMVSLLNHDHDKPISFKAGDGIMQGIILNCCFENEYDRWQWKERGVDVRSGGFGSTGGAN